VCELGNDGKEHALWQPCEVWGQKAEAAGELEASDMMLIEGKFRRTKKGDAWETVVSGFEVHLLQRTGVGATVVS
jgi:hypothetical protein